MMHMLVAARRIQSRVIAFRKTFKVCQDVVGLTSVDMMDIEVIWNSADIVFPDPPVQQVAVAGRAAHVPCVGN